MALPGAGLSEQDARDLKLFQAHRQAFFAWQMGGGGGDSSTRGDGSAADQSELQARPFNKISCTFCSLSIVL